MTLLPASDKAEGICPPELVAVAHAAPALNTVIVSEGVTDVLHAATDCDVLNRPRIRCLGHQKFGNIAPQFYHLFRVRIDDHAFLYIERTGGGNF